VSRFGRADDKVVGIVGMDEEEDLDVLAEGRSLRVFEFECEFGCKRAD
jgi:hypothetical protein